MLCARSLSFSLLISTAHMHTYLAVALGAYCFSSFLFLSLGIEKEQVQVLPPMKENEVSRGRLLPGKKRRAQSLSDQRTAKTREGLSKIENAY
jgi:hypothetical protein